VTDDLSLHYRPYSIAPACVLAASLSRSFVVTDWHHSQSTVSVIQSRNEDVLRTVAFGGGAPGFRFIDYNVSP